MRLLDPKEIKVNHISVQSLINLNLNYLLWPLVASILYTSIDEYPWADYPPFLSNRIYFIDRLVIGKLLAAAQSTPYYRYDAVYLSGLCANKANVTLWSADEK